MQPLKNICYSIDERVFKIFPCFLRGVVVAREVNNSRSSKELVQLLRSEEENLRNRLDVSSLAAHPSISCWREAFREIGIKPGQYRSSIESMARRVLRGNELPAINGLVDIGNIISLRYILPVGGHALDEVKGSISLRPADGTEHFMPFGSEQMEHPQEGEWIFTEGDQVLTRRWVWRQSNHTLTELSTTFIEFNIDALLPLTIDDVKIAGEDLISLVGRFCGGNCEFHVLSKENMEMQIQISHR